ncbi:MAG: helix-turn-helix domain-containing protein [Caulobacterales bacterium]
MDTFRFKGARHAAKIDQQVGDRIRRRRTLLGYTQEQLAEALDISYQQIQKYETGANRVSAGRLYQIAQRLEAPVTYFFEGLGVDFDGDVDQPASAGSNRATIELVRNFNHIADSAVRNAVASLVKSLSGGEQSAISTAAQDVAAQDSAAARNGGSNGSNNGSPSNGAS